MTRNTVKKPALKKTTRNAEELARELERTKRALARTSAELREVTAVAIDLSREITAWQLGARSRAA